MRKFGAISVTALCWALSCPTLAQTGIKNGSMNIGGSNRTYLEYVPAGLPANPSLVIAVHGMDETSEKMRSLSAWDLVADTAKIVVVYPQSKGNTWDLGANGNDIKYMLAIIDTMAKRHNIDRDRVYEYGFSMGGMMSYALTCAVADKFAAIAPTSGYSLGGAGNCAPKRPMPIYHIHGVADNFVKYSGAVPFHATMRAKFKCPATPKVVNSYMGNSKLKKETWGPCDGETESAFLHISGLAHKYHDYKDFHVANDAWNFLKRFSLGSTTAIRTPGSPEAGRFQVSARYAEGEIRLQGSHDLQGAKVYDLQGKLVQVWRAEGGRKSSAAIPVTLPSGGVYLLKVEGATGQAARETVGYLPIP
jgi:poly(3-hydroxybutyrate) depolymerase